VRTFLAVFPPAEVAGRVSSVLDALRKPADGVSWVRSANLHYTMRFLGDLTDRDVEAARRATSQAARACAPFRLTLGAQGMFPNSKQPRVLWLGAVGGADALVALALALETALATEGFPPADKPFAPHLTVGRVRDRADAGSVGLRFAAADFPGGVSFEVGDLAVVKSTLAAGGSRYEVVARYSLGG
jgi:RNA 2',3'-cyclic 3'-phosphodiesterase